MTLQSDVLLVWGAGGHGRVVADLILAGGGRVAGFIDRDSTRLGHAVAGADGRIVMAEAEWVERLRRDAPLPDGAAGVALGVGDNRARAACRAALGGVRLPALVHPRAVVSRFAELGRGAVVMAGAVVNAGAVVGAGAVVNSGAIVEHDCVVGDDAHVSPGAVLTGAVRIGRGAWVGAGATVTNGVMVGEWSVVGAGAVAIGDVAAGATVVGVPAKLLRRRD